MQPRSEDSGAHRATIRVLDAGEPVEDAKLRLMRLPDGRLGALWRGQVFPLAADGSIDIAGPFEPTDACRPLPTAPGTQGWSLLEGHEEAVLLLQGDALTRDAALAALRAAGLSAIRAYPALNPDLEADWSIRLLIPREGPPLRERIAALLGESAVEPTPPSTEERLRLRLLEQQMQRVLAERDRLRAEVEMLRRAQTEALSGKERNPALERVRELEREVERAHAEIEALQKALADAEARVRPGSRADDTRLHRRLAAEIEAFLEAFPRIELVGDSILTLLTDYSARTSVYRVLSELERGVELHRRFKPVRGADGWWECHVSTGHDDSGRIYIRWAVERWRVLVSIKEAQKRDLAWLKSNLGNSARKAPQSSHP